MAAVPAVLTPRTAAFTAAALVAFAANSVLCRLALGRAAIDAASFASVRVVSGAVTLVLILLVQRGTATRLLPKWQSIAALFGYVAFFSFAYRSLSAGTGALILFGCVQITMFTVAIRQGERFTAISWAGLAAAVLGLVYLVSRGVTAPDPLGAVLMAGAGVGWGFYSVLGRGARDPLAATASNFVYTVPLVLLVSVVFWHAASLSPEGVALAIASGAIASGCGYVIWYAALPGLTATRAATVQFSVPVITAFAGVLLLGEPVTLRLVVASVVTLGGVAVVLAQRASTSSH